MSLGQLVFSKAGRDSGRPFVIVAIPDNNYVLLADGKLRRIEQAKKKKVKHITKTDFVDAIIKDKLDRGLKISNSELRKTISAYLDKEGLEEGLNFV